MVEFVYQEMFPLGEETTEYRKLTNVHISIKSFEGADVLQVESEGLALLAEQAFRDASHLLRPSHLESLAYILNDPEATDNDRYVAREMLKACMADKHKPYGLHRLGIAMHVYADTWAHQGFAGINHKINKASNIRSQDHKDDARLLKKLANYFLSRAFPLGHGAVLTYPDRPYIDWRYKNGMGQAVARNNTEDFVEAADNMCLAMQRWLRDDPDAPAEGLPPADKLKLGRLFKNVKNEDGEKRHAVWLKKIAAGYFSFGSGRLSYVPKGRYSWKHKALGKMEWVDDPHGEPFVYKESFLTSDWKMFHDALQAHRFDVIHDILPKFGICVG